MYQWRSQTGIMFTHTQLEILSLENYARNRSKVGAALKGKNLLPGGANSFH